MWHRFNVTVVQLHLLFLTGQAKTVAYFHLVKDSVFKKICMKEEGAQWNVYQLALIADA